MRLRSTLGGTAGLILFVLSGAVGGIVGFLIARASVGRSLQPGAHPVATPLAGLDAIAAIGAGVLVGWFLAIVLLSWAPGRTRCPRCGTRNRRGVPACWACQLPFV